MAGRRSRPPALPRLSSGAKMLFIMTGALMPLGLVALFASIQAAQHKWLQHEADARLAATAEARQIDLLIYRSANVLRFAAAAADRSGVRCTALLGEAARLLPYAADIALYAPDGTLRCATPFAARGLPPPRGNIGIELRLLASPGGIRYTVAAIGGSYAVGQIRQRTLVAALSSVADLDEVALRQGDARLDLSGPAGARREGRQQAVAAPIAGGQIMLVARGSGATVTVAEALLALLPILMWIAAALIGWLVVNELLLRPLGQLQRAVARFGSDGDGFALPRLQTPAREIAALGAAFTAAAGQLAQRGAELEQGLHRQVRLTREVHHRVKNNLQVVASLINLHARGTDGAVAAAYASIQRRVDALAVVHRNHYAELEENRGVALRALLAELTSNLRATAPAGASGFAIALDMTPVHVSQDVAVPIAFLVTEVVELLMECAPRTAVIVALADAAEPHRTTLSITSEGFEAAPCRDHPHRQRFERIVTGLARQLRSPLGYDAAAGRYSISLATLETGPAR